jgi:hypothetical protein
MPIRRRRKVNNERDRDRVRREFVRVSETGATSVQLFCPNGHPPWNSAIDGKSIARMGLKRPRCRDCNAEFETWAPQGNYKHVEGAVCDHNCKRANPYTDCTCSCGRKNHGIEHPDYPGNQ